MSVQTLSTKHISTILTFALQINILADGDGALSLDQLGQMIVDLNHQTYATRTGQEANPYTYQFEPVTEPALLTPVQVLKACRAAIANCSAGTYYGNHYATRVLVEIMLFTMEKVDGWDQAKWTI